MTTNQKLNIEVWSQPSCPWCDRVKQLIVSKGHEYTEKMLGDTGTKEELFNKAPSVRSVPQVFINDQHVGGFNEVQEYFKSQ